MHQTYAMGKVSFWFITGDMCARAYQGRGGWTLVTFIRNGKLLSDLEPNSAATTDVVISNILSTPVKLKPGSI
jgi:hypothetical protein